MAFLPDFCVATKNKNAHICLICCAFYFPMLLELEQKISFLDRHYLVSVHNAENQLQSFFPVERDCKLYKIVATIVTECQLEK